MFISQYVILHLIHYMAPNTYNLYFECSLGRFCYLKMYKRHKKTILNKEVCSLGKKIKVISIILNDLKSS